MFDRNSGRRGESQNKQEGCGSGFLSSNESKQQERMAALEGSRSSFSLDDLKQSAPTILALAELCRLAIISPSPDPGEDLTLEEKTLLVAARDYGSFEVVSDLQAFQFGSRIMSVRVELPEQRYLNFKIPSDPVYTMRYLEAFFGLCRRSLIVHQHNAEFSLSAAGYRVAMGLEKPEVQSELEKPESLDLSGWEDDS